jgi:DNA-binding response OmpR family regulator
MEEEMGTNGLGALLLIEDEYRLRTLVAQVLQGEGYRVIEAADGPEGVDRFVDSGPFDLLLVDLNLPGFSGVEVCRRILLREPGQRIMICSAAIVPESERELLDLGIDHFLTKPYRAEDLLAHIASEIGSPGAASVPLSLRTRHA